MLMSNPREEHLVAMQQLLRYLKGTLNIILCFKTNKLFLHEYSNINQRRNLDGRKSTSNFLLTHIGIIANQISKIQQSDALSTNEIEHMALLEVGKEIIWLKNFINELGKNQINDTLYNDSQSTIHLIKSLIFHVVKTHIATLSFHQEAN